MHSLAHGRSGDHRPSKGSRNAACVAKLRAASGGGGGGRDFTVPDFPSSRSPSPRGKKSSRAAAGDVEDRSDCESVGSCPSPPPDPARSHRSGIWRECDDDRDPERVGIRSKSKSRSASSTPQASNPRYSTSVGCTVTEKSGAARSSRSASPKKSSSSRPAAGSSGRQNELGEGDGGVCEPDEYGPDGYEPSSSALTVDTPYPARWRCFGRRPPAFHEFRPMGEMRVRNVRPAGKQTYLMRKSDMQRGCASARDEGDLWDDNYGLAKPVTDRWSTPEPYGTVKVIRTGDLDPMFEPSRGDLIVINPAQNYYRAMKSGYVMSLRGRNQFGIGDLVVRLGKFLPNGQYVPYGNLELYMYTATRDWRFLGRQPYLLVDFNYHNLDYESPGKYLAIGTFLTGNFSPRRGDIIIRGSAWAENYPNKHRRHHSSVKYWKPGMDFLPNDMLLRPYVDIGRCQKTMEFYWGAAELYSFSGKGLAWAYWGRDHHVCDTPYPRETEPIKTGHHKNETGHYAEV